MARTKLTAMTKGPSSIAKIGGAVKKLVKNPTIRKIGGSIYDHLKNNTKIGNYIKGGEKVYGGIKSGNVGGAISGFKDLKNQASQDLRKKRLSSNTGGAGKYRSASSMGN